MIVERRTLLAAPPSKCAAAVMTPALLQIVAYPLVQFEPMSPSGWPIRWEEAPFPVRMKLFGCLPLGIQTIDISILSAPAGSFQLRDSGHSKLIARWDHRIRIEAAANGTCYTDHVEIEAGWRTPFVWLFAQVFFTHRQRRLCRLAASGDLARLVSVLSS